MPRAAAQEKRHYLARDDRRNALLDVAAEVVEKQGWQALSMISVAEAAGVSRQLVYQHFSSVDELMTDTMTHVFSDIYEGIRKQLKSDPAKVMEMVLAAETETFKLSRNRARALWQILTLPTAADSDAGRASRRIRHLITKMWTPTVRMVFGLDEREGRALAWMLNMAFWGAHQLVEEKEIDQASASRLVLKLIQSAAGSAAALPGTATKQATSRARASAGSAG